MHRLELFILTRLIEESQAGFAQLKPRHTEGSLFTYHLRQLIKQGMIEKTAGGKYRLTSQGKLYADKLHLDTLKLQEQPNIVVLVACHDEKKGWLLFERSTQPTIHMLGFPRVHIELGRDLLTQSEAAFEQLSGLKANLAHKGDGYVTFTKKGEIESRILFHLLYGQNPSGVLIENADNGNFLWQKPVNFNDHNMMPSMKDLIKLIDESRDKRFFAELAYNLNEGEKS